MQLSIFLINLFVGTYRLSSHARLEAFVIQTKLNLKCFRLAVYARNKHLIVNTSKSEVVHFNSAGDNVPVFYVGGATLHYKHSFRYSGIVFYRTLNMAKSAEHVARPFLASAYKIRIFVREHALADRPHIHFFVAR